MDFSRRRTIAIYARVSTESETQLHALDNQIEWYDAYLKDKPNWTVYKLYSDPGISGTSLKKRKAFLQMIEDAQEKKFDLVLTREIPRFARNTMDALNCTRYLKSMGIEVYFAFEHLSSFEDDEFIFTILAAMAQKESLRTSERVKAGQKIIRQKAVDCGAVPYGYKKVEKKLIPDDKTAPLVQEIFNLYVSGEGTRKIAQRMEQRGYVTPKGKTHWAGTIINYILTNPVYKGIMVYNRYYVTDFLTHKIVKNRGEIEKTVIEGKHEPLISAEIFDKAQEIMQKKAQLYGGTNRRRGVCPSKNIWQLRLICGECGGKFSSAGGGYYVNKDGAAGRTLERRFICYKQREYGTPRIRAKLGLESICSTPSVWTNELRAIWKELITFIRIDKYSIKTRLLDAIQKVMPGMDDNALKKKENVEKATKKLDIKYEKLLDAFLDGIIDKETFSKRSEQLKREKNVLRMDFECDTIKSITFEAKDIIQRLEEILNKEFDYQVLAEALIEKIVVYTDRYEWYVKGIEVSGKSVTPDRQTSCSTALNSDIKIDSPHSVYHSQLISSAFS